MEFTYIVPNSVERTIKTQAQVSRHSFPVWVTAITYLLILISVFGLTAIIHNGLRILILRLTGIENGLLSLLPALFIAYILTMRFIVPFANNYFLKFGRFDIDFEYTSQFSISEAGLLIDEGDRVTRIAWSGIGGVFRTKDFIGFYCRGLVYTIPFEFIANEEDSHRLYETCKIWQAAAAGHHTAKAFI